MAFADLSPADIMYGPDLRFLEESVAEYPDATEAAEILLAESREAVRLDLYEAWDLDETDETDQAAFEERAALSPDRIRRAIAARQMLFYFGSRQGADSFSFDARKAREWTEVYREIKLRFPLIGKSRGNATVSTLYFGT